MNYEKAIATWGDMAKTRYSDVEIKNCIASGSRFSGTDVSNEDYAQACFQKAMAMIAYNEMINRRINSAKKTWGVV